MCFTCLFKNRFVSSLLAFMVIGSLGLPSLTAWTHAFSDHQEPKCTDSTTLHIHKVEGDCAFVKFKPAPQFYFTVAAPRIYYPEPATSPIRTTYRFIPTLKSIHFLLRGPPDQPVS